MTNDIQRGIITLIKSAVTEQPGQLPEGFSLEEAFPIVQKHQIIPLAFDGAECCGVSRKTPTMRRMFQAYCRCSLCSEAQMEMAERIFGAFDQNGIDYMPLKGCNLKSLYPKPEMRQMGDADILIRMEQYPKIKPILLQLGFEELKENDYELKWGADQLQLELHKRIFPAESKRLCAYYGDGWRLGKRLKGSRYGMSAEDEFVYLFAHFAKHYRGGVGLRHVVDLWVYRRTHPQMDAAYIEQQLAELHLLDFFRNTCKLIAVWFESGEPDDLTDHMADFIFSSGSWGTLDYRKISDELKKNKRLVRSGKAKQSAMLRAVFPGVDEMKYRYTALQKAPFLLPVFWVVRWVRTLLFRREMIQKRQEMIDIVTDEKVTAYLDAMRYVGLVDYFGE